MNYGELQTTIKAYTHRRDLDAVIPTFIELAESRISTALRSLENEELALLSMTSNPFPLPADYAEASAVTAQADRGPRALERVTPTRMARMQSIGANMDGAPRYFTVAAGQITVWPFVTNPTELDITYWTQLAALVLDPDTNAILTRWPQLYLYASLVEAYVYIADTDRRDEALTIFTSEIDFINGTGGGAKWGVAPSVQAG